MSFNLYIFWVFISLTHYRFSFLFETHSRLIIQQISVFCLRSAPFIHFNKFFRIPNSMSRCIFRAAQLYKKFFLPLTVMYVWCLIFSLLLLFSCYVCVSKRGSFCCSYDNQFTNDYLQRFLWSQAKNSRQKRNDDAKSETKRGKWWWPPIEYNAAVFGRSMYSIFKRGT